MATVALPNNIAATRHRVPPLESGDHLTAAEFERRYFAMPSSTKAELINGVVYVASPVSFDEHSSPQVMLIGCLFVYMAATPGVQPGDNATILLDDGNMPQPDGLLFIQPECGGQCRREGKYLGSMPELVVEVAASSASQDLHDKRDVYFRNGAQEYVVWRVFDRAIDWFVRRGRTFESVPPAAGVFRSTCFPGLWLDVQALIDGDAPRAYGVVLQGLASPEHASFVTELARRRAAFQKSTG